MRRKFVLMGLAFVAAGLYPLAVAFGLATPAPGSLQAPLWVVGLAGACFVLIGGSLLLSPLDVRVRGLLAGVVVTCMALICDWTAFGPGERHFSTSMSLGGIGARSGSGEESGRIVFGVAAVVLDLCAAWGWYRWLRTRTT